MIAACLFSFFVNYACSVDRTSQKLHHLIMVQFRSQLKVIKSYEILSLTSIKAWKYRPTQTDWMSKVAECGSCNVTLMFVNSVIAFCTIRFK